MLCAYMELTGKVAEVTCYFSPPHNYDNIGETKSNNVFIREFSWKEKLLTEFRQNTRNYIFAWSFHRGILLRKSVFFGEKKYKNSVRNAGFTFSNFWKRRYRTMHNLYNKEDVKKLIAIAAMPNINICTSLCICRINYQLYFIARDCLIFILTWFSTDRDADRNIGWWQLYSCLRTIVCVVQRNVPNWQSFFFFNP